LNPGCEKGEAESRACHGANPGTLNYARDPAKWEGQATRTRLPEGLQDSSSNLIQKLAIDFLLLLLFPYDDIGSWIAVQDNFIASRTYIELNGRCHSESEIAIREDEPQLQPSEQRCQTNQEINRTSAASTVISLNEDRITLAEVTYGAGVHHGPTILFWSVFKAGRLPPSPIFGV
jgi:hypothetical protein